MARSRGEKPEKTRPGNPIKLTVRQHVYPAKLIEHFTNQTGYVDLHDIGRRLSFPAAPDNERFCARRAWDHGTETGFMKRIEDRFHQALEPILSCRVDRITSRDRAAVDAMFALWFQRARNRELESQEVELYGVLGSDLSKEQEETLEKNGYIFSRKNGKMPARLLNGTTVKLKVGRHSNELKRLTGWGVVRALEGQFIVPDAPTKTILPVSPTVALIAEWPDGGASAWQVGYINQALREDCQDYFFAHNLTDCPGIS